MISGPSVCGTTVNGDARGFGFMVLALLLFVRPAWGQAGQVRVTGTAGPQQNPGYPCP